MRESWACVLTLCSSGRGRRIGAHLHRAPITLKEEKEDEGRKRSCGPHRGLESSDKERPLDGARKETERSGKRNWKRQAGTQAGRKASCDLGCHKNEEPNSEMCISLSSEIRRQTFSRSCLMMACASCVPIGGSVQRSADKDLCGARTMARAALLALAFCSPRVFADDRRRERLCECPHITLFSDNSSYLKPIPVSVFNVVR